MAVDLAEITGAKAAQEAKKKEAPKVANGLDKDAFMRLFLEQLKNQDPTAPMETDKIITQTAQLTQVEMQEENKKTMKEVAEAMKSTKATNEALKNFQSDLKKTLEKMDKGVDESVNANAYLAQVSALNAVSMIGKIAETDVNGVQIGGSGGVKFVLYFDKPIDESAGKPSIQIFDKDKRLIKTLTISGKSGESGYIGFEWDGLDDQGKRVAAGVYDIRAEYNLNPQTNQYSQARVGRGEVESIVFDKGKPMIKMGAMVLPMDSVIEFYDKDSGKPTMSLEQVQAQAARIRAQEHAQEEEMAKAKPQTQSQGQKNHPGSHELADKPTQADFADLTKSAASSQAQNAQEEEMVGEKNGTNLASHQESSADGGSSLTTSMPLNRGSAG